MSESASVSGAQGQRLDESSAAGGSLPGLRLNQNCNQAVLSHLMANADNAEPDDDFFDMLVKCQVPNLAKYLVYKKEAYCEYIQYTRNLNMLSVMSVIGIAFG